MTNAQCGSIRAFMTTMDMSTPRTIESIQRALYEKYPYFWYEEEKVRSVMEHFHADSFTLGNDKTYYYFEDEAFNKMCNTCVKDNAYRFRRLEEYKAKHGIA